MEFWLDTTDFEIITRANHCLQITGVTTNPSILSKSSLPVKETIERLLTIQQGYVAVQVTADDAENMYQQAKKLSAFSERIIVKIPATEEGFLAIHRLSQKNVPTLATAIYEPAQILLSILAGANYAAPYLSKISVDIDECYDALYDMIEIVTASNSDLKIMAAAISNKQQIIECAKAGIPAITVPAPVYQELMAIYPPTLTSLAMFQKDWGAREEVSAAFL